MVYDELRALDVGRYLRNEPVSAGPPSISYRLSKFVKRNKVPLVFGTLAVLALAIGFGTSTMMFFREKQARSEQERLRVKAEIARSNEEELRRLAEYREQISNAAVLVSHGNLADADRLLQSVPFGQVPPSLEAAEAYLKVGEWHVLAERWFEATDCFANLALVLPMIDPADSFDISVVVIRAAALLSLTGNLERYDLIRQQAIERFSDTSSAVVAEQVFKATLILPPPPKLLPRYAPWAPSLRNA